MSEVMMDYCAFFETEDEAIAHCRQVNGAIKRYLLTSQHHEKMAKAFEQYGKTKDAECARRAAKLARERFDQECCAVINGPDNNYAVVDLETAKEILDYPASGLPCLVVTD